MNVFVIFCLRYKLEQKVQKRNRNFRLFNQLLPQSQLNKLYNVRAYRKQIYTLYYHVKGQIYGTPRIN